MPNLHDVRAAVERTGKKATPIRNNRFRAQCPAHDGRGLNLAFRVDHNGNIRFECMSHGCAWHDVAEAIGMGPEHFFEQPRQQRWSPGGTPTLQERDDLDLMIIEIARADRQMGKKLSEREKGEELAAFRRLKARGIAVPTGTPRVDEIQYEAHLRGHTHGTA